MFDLYAFSGAIIGWFLYDIFAFKGLRATAISVLGALCIATLLGFLFGYFF